MSVCSYSWNLREKQGKASLFYSLLISLCLFTFPLFAQEDLSPLDDGLVKLASELEEQANGKVKEGIVVADSQIAVMEFLESNTDRRLELSNYLEAGLTTEMVKISRFNILDREKSKQIQDAIDKPFRELAGTSLIPEGVKFNLVVTGSFAILGEEYQIVAQLLDVKSGQIYASSQIKVATKSIPSRLLEVAAVSIAELELAQIRRADEALNLGDKAKAILFLEEFFLKFPNSTRRTEVQQRIDRLNSREAEANGKVEMAERLMEQESLEGQARDVLIGVMKNFAELPASITASGLLIVLDLSESKEGAIESSYTFEAKYPQHPIVLKIQKERTEHQNREELKKQAAKASEFLVEAKDLYEKNKIFEAREVFKSIAFKFPDSEVAKEAKLFSDQMDQEEAEASKILGVAKVLLDNPQTQGNSRAELEKIKTEYPKTMAYVNATGYLLILDLRAQKDVTREVAYFLVTYPNHSLVARLKVEQEAYLVISAPVEEGSEELKVAKNLLDKNLNEDAEEILEALSKKYAGARVGIEAAGLLILNHLKICKYSNSEIIKYTTRHRKSPQTILILEAQNKALQTCAKEQLAAKIEGMVYVEAGEIILGNPQQKVFLDDFYIDTHEVSNVEYRRCVTKGNCKKSLHDGNNRYNAEQQPVVGVDWFNAKNYCLFLGKRLASEYEWEWAALGGVNQKDQAMTKEDLSTTAWYRNGEKLKFSKSRGTKAANALGLYDMIGNVSEWVEDWYNHAYYQKIPYKNPTGPEKGSKKVHRGGNFTSKAKFLIPFLNRSRERPNKRKNNLGFRCAKSVVIE